MKRQYTQAEAESLVNKMFETHQSIGAIPRYTRGRVIEALDLGDHWNVLIEWERPHQAVQLWYDKYDVQASMRPLGANLGTHLTTTDDRALEIRSSHDLGQSATGARSTGRHSYQVSCRGFAVALDAWRNDKAKRSNALGLTTLADGSIWITSIEARRVSAAIAATQLQVTID